MSGLHTAEAVGDENGDRVSGGSEVVVKGRKFSFVRMPLKAVGEDIEPPAEHHASLDSRRYPHAHPAHQLLPRVRIKRLGAVGSHKMSDRILRLEGDELVEDECTFVRPKDFVRPLAHNLAFPPEPSRQWAIAVEWVAFEPPTRIEGVREPHPVQPLLASPRPALVVTPLNPLLPHPRSRYGLGIVEEDSSARRSVERQLRGASRRRRKRGRWAGVAHKIIEGPLE